jgi:hypothetical protein
MLLFEYAYRGGFSVDATYQVVVVAVLVGAVVGGCGGRCWRVVKAVGRVGTGGGRVLCRVIDVCGVYKVEVFAD